MFLGTQLTLGMREPGCLVVDIAFCCADEACSQGHKWLEDLKRGGGGLGANEQRNSLFYLIKARQTSNMFGKTHMKLLFQNVDFMESKYKSNIWDLILFCFLSLFT